MKDLVSTMRSLLAEQGGGADAEETDREAALAVTTNAAEITASGGGE